LRVTIKTFLIAILAAAALIGAAVVAVPSSSQRTSEPTAIDRIG
jgi:hypothetical protein